MNILCSVIADVLHIIGILLICKFYLQLKEKTDDKYRYLKILIVSVSVTSIRYYEYIFAGIIYEYTSYKNISKVRKKYE